VKSDSNRRSFQRWIELANLVQPGVQLPLPEVIAQNWHPAPRAAWSPAGLVQSEESEESQVLEKLWRVSELLETLWRTWQEQFGQEQSLSDSAPAEEIANSGRQRANEIAKGLVLSQRAASLKVEVSFFLRRRARGRPRKGDQVGVVNKLEEWRPRDELQLYRLFYPIRKCLDAFADSHLMAGKLRVIDMPATVSIFIAPDDDISVFQGITGQFLKELIGTDPRRIRRCPICSRIYYAWRRDKGACSPRCCDTYYARKFRLKRRQYEETRQVNRLVATGMPLNKAKAELQKREKRRKPPNE
jgi:hypothetical protein